MTVHDQDKDRLFLSTLISSVLFAILFLFLNTVRWDTFEPFPETVPVVLLELEPVPEETPLPPTPKEISPVPLSPPHPEVSEARDLPAPTPLPPSPSEPALPAQKTTPSSPSQTQPSSLLRTPTSPPPPLPSTPPSQGPPPAPSPFPLRQPAPQPVPKRIDPFTTAEGVDPRLSERQFLEAEKSRLETWLKEYESTSTIPAPSQSPTQPEVTTQPADPAVERIRQQLADINRRIQNLPSSPSTPSDAQADTTQATSPGVLQPILDREGLEIGRGNLRGRVPLFPLQIGRIYPEDFEGFPIQDLQLHAEFLIGESGLIEPGSLKISGDSRYTRIIAKVLTALERWRFDTRKGVITPASITFIIKVRGLSR
ncbi:MAG: hypothetical protein SNJ78_11675 [Spirochaetales bacterium]